MPALAAFQNAGEQSPTRFGDIPVRALLVPTRSGRVADFRCFHRDELKGLRHTRQDGGVPVVQSPRLSPGPLQALPCLLPRFLEPRLLRDTARCFRRIPSTQSLPRTNKGLVIQQRVRSWQAVLAACRRQGYELRRGWRGRTSRQPGQVRKEAAATSNCPGRLPASLNMDRDCTQWQKKSRRSVQNQA